MNQLNNLQKKGENIDFKEAHEFAQKFNMSMRKTAEAVLELGSVYYQAHQKLTGEAYEQFLSEIKFKKNDSTLSKLKLIGEKYELLKQAQKELPPSWTSIYKIAKQSDEVIKSLIESGNLSSSLKGQDLDRLLGVAPKTESKKLTNQDTPKIDMTSTANDNGYMITVKLYQAPTEDQKAMLKSITRMLKMENIDYQASESLEPFFI